MSNVEEFPTFARGLSEYEALLAGAPTVLEAIPGGVYLCDNEGWVVRYNREAAELWGRQPAIDHPAARFCGSHRLFMRDGAPLSPEDCPMADAVRNGTVTRNAEVIMEKPDSSRVVVLVNIRPLRDRRGKIQGAINCFQDISAQKALQQEVQRKTAELEDFFDNAAVGLHIVSAEGIIVRANKAELALLGYAPEEYIGRHIVEFHVDAPVIGDILHRLTTGEKVERCPARLRAKDGSVKHVLITSSSRLDGGKFVNTRCFTTDVTSIRQAEDARRDSEQRLDATYEAAHIGIAEADADARLLRVNDAICKILGRSREELLSMSFLDYTHEDDRDKDKTLYAQQVAGDLDSYMIRKRGVKPDGSGVYLDVYSSSVRDASGSFRYGVRIIQDVTATQQAEERLRESERRMRELLEALPAAVYTTDEKGRITFYNHAAVDLAGRTPQLGEEWCVTWRLYNPDGTFLPHDQCPMAVTLKEDRPVRGVEAIAERPDGTRVPFMPYPTPLHDLEGRLVGAINMLVDLSESKKAQNYGARLAAIVEFSDDAIISKDVSGVIQTWNKGAERLFGYKTAEVIGKPLGILIPPDRRDEEPEILERIRRGDHIDHYETVRMRKDGSLVDVSVTISPLMDAQGRVVGASKIARDITERRHQEERRQLLVHELNHRVKNTLATVQSLAVQSFRGEEMRAAVGQFQGRLIALARAHDALTREDWRGMDLEQLIRRAVAPICVELERRFDIEGPDVRLKPKLALSLSMAFHELCTNAAKYGALTTDRGQIRIQWQLEGAKDEARLLLNWTEIGGPKVERPREKGFGSRLLEHALGWDDDAEVSLTFEPTGVVFAIDILLT